MKKRISLLFALLALASPSLSVAYYRIAYSADGNKHDADDWHASVLALAMIAESGQKHRLVHFDYNNHLGNSDWRMARTHRNNVLGAVRTYGYPAGRFFDVQSNLKGAVSSIARAVNQSSAGNRLYLICAGPMEVCYRGIALAQDAKERYVTVVSHSWWNENHNDTSQLNRRWRDIQRDFRVQTVQIADQNDTAFRSHPNAWDWLKHQRNGKWVHQAVARNTSAGDASDAGMAYYVLKGRARSSQWANMGDIKAVFDSRGSNSDEAGGSRHGTGVTPPGQPVALEARISHKCPQVANGSKANGANIDQWACAGNGNQKWDFERTWGSRYALRSQHTGKCLGINARFFKNGANVAQWGCHKGENQQLDLVPRGNGWFSLKVKQSNKCLTVANSSTRNGGNITQWNCHGGWDQQFRFNGAG
jgi:hypothetical protein